MTSKSGGRILVVEDSQSLSRLYAGQLAGAGFITEIAGTAAETREKNGSFDPDAVLLDLGLPDGDGLVLLKEMRGSLMWSAVVVITGNASIAKAVEAVRAGAHDYLVKPVNADRLIATVRSALAARCRERRQQQPTRRAEGSFGFVGRSAAMLEVYRKIESIATSRAAVFITGESGTGKELCAEAIHRHGSRAQRPFVALNCGAIPRDLMESEVFGHLKGAFTGAVGDRDGAAKQADGGTLFLDEVCEMDLALQTKLLRFLQTGEIRKVGAAQSERVDARIVCATNRDPMAEVAHGRFRADLFYRLHVLPVAMPPLRARADDIPLLAQHFLTQAAVEERRPAPALSSAAARLLACHDWPGNVRELYNVIRQAVVLGDAGELGIEAFAHLGSGKSRAVAIGEPCSELRRIERETIETTIAGCGGSIPKAARRLGVSPSTIYRKREAWSARLAN